MSWAMATRVPPAPVHHSPLSRMDLDRDGYGYSGGYKGRNHNAALSALALISFLFFLNLLQQQLTSGQQQTLLFMVNNTGGNTGSGGRRRREAADQPAVPDKDFAKVQAELLQEELVRKYFQDEPPERTHTSPKRPKQGGKKAKRKLKGRTLNMLPLLVKPPTLSEWRPLADWLRSQVTSETNLPHHLEETLEACRSIVACTLYSPPYLDDEVVRTILAADGPEGLDPGGGTDIRTACASALEMTSDDCAVLAQLFTKLIASSSS